MVTTVLLLSLLASIVLAHPQLGGEWPIEGHGGLGVAVGVYVGPFGQYEGMSIQIQMIYSESMYQF
jgi:hypothetical protein